MRAAILARKPVSYKISPRNE
ncbi:Hypothetical protein BROD_2490 [Brucella sp. NF 2653]|nr:Hypothetical protein BROD_2490 [Brucella sp. NF 2653]